MKKIDIKRGFLLLPVLLLALAGCKKDEESCGQLSVTQVTLNNTTSTTEVITAARVGTTIRIDGSGFSSLQALYCNGYSINVNPNYVTDGHIIFTISTDTPVGDDAPADEVNTIRLVTKSGEQIIDFTIQGPAPGITSVSNTLPKEGDVIHIYGAELRDIDSIVFPGHVHAVTYSNASDYKSITVTVPTGGTTTGGALKVCTNNGTAFSYNYMNRSDCVFLHQFNWNNSSTEYGYSGSGQDDASSGLVRLTATIPTTGDGPKSYPTGYASFGNGTSTAAVATNQGVIYFKMEQVVAFINGKAGITGDTSCDKLALQVDFYVPFTLNSGYFTTSFYNNGQSAYLAAPVAPWVTGSTATPLTMDGWTTVTIPLSTATGMSGKGLASAVGSDQQAYIRFANRDYTTGGGTTLAAKAIPNFIWYISNMRLVPYVIPTNDETNI